VSEWVGSWNIVRVFLHIHFLSQFKVANTDSEINKKMIRR